MSQKLRILIAPLDWGLGHASRCVPVIQALLDADIEPLLGGNPQSLHVLKAEFPSLTTLELPAYGVTYAKGNQQLFRIAWQIPRLLGVISKERKILAEVMRTHHLDAVISDNRYGLYHEDLPSIFLCHQLNLQLPPHLRFLARPINALHRKAIAHFDQCWVPDFLAGKSLAGELSQHQLSQPQTYIGPISRLSAPIEKSEMPSLPAWADHPPDVLVVLSGPEPQRSLLEDKILAQAQNLPQQFWIVQGKAGPLSVQQVKNCLLISFFQSQQLRWAYSLCQRIISRSGYSSLMDYHALGLTRLFLVPTPGQTEQEYLARRWARQGKAIFQEQDQLNLEKGLMDLDHLPEPAEKSDTSNHLQKAIQELKSSLLLKKRENNR